METYNVTVEQQFRGLQTRPRNGTDAKGKEIEEEKKKEEKEKRKGGQKRKWKLMAGGTVVWLDRNRHASSHYAYIRRHGWCRKTR